MKKIAVSTQNYYDKGGVVLKLLPNILTVIRLLLVPVFVCVYFFTNDNKIAAWIFLAAGLTDVLDGYIARKFHMESRFGALADPLADKLLHLSVTACLALSGVPFMWIVFVILVIKESALIIGAAKLYKQKNIIIAALWYGKAASLIIFIVIWSIIYMGDAMKYQMKAALALIAALTAILSGMGYTINYFKNVKTR